MPRQIDLRPQNLKVSNDPNNQLGFTQEQIVHLQSQIPEALEKAQLLFINNVLTSIDQATGLDLEKFSQDALAHITYTGNLAADLWNYYVGTNTTANAAQQRLQQSEAAFTTLLQSFQTAISGYTDWPTFIAAIESAWNTYSTTESSLASANVVTIQQFFNSLLGLNGSSTGLLSAGSIQGLQDAFNQLGAALSGDVANAGGWTWLANIMNTWFGVSSSAHSMSVSNTNTLAIRTNKPLVYGLDNTTESNIPFNTATTAVGVISGQSVFVPIRCTQTDVKNTVAFVASLPSTHQATHAFANLWRFDTTAGKFNLLASSSDFIAQLSTSPAWIFMSANATSVMPGDVLVVEFNPGSTTVGNYFNVMGSPGNGTIPAHPTAILPGTSASLSGTGTPPSSPGVTQINSSSVTFSNANPIPYVGLETSAPPPPVYPDHQEVFTYTRTYTIDTWAQHIDIVGVGQGGGGQGETGGTVGRGGSPGVWGGMTLAVGTDIAAGGAITVTVQPNPSNRGTSEPGSGGAYFGNGQSGGATVFSWTKPGAGTQTMTCAGGQGGGIGNNNNLTTYGQGPGNFTLNGYTYTGGANVLTPTDGYAPGSSGPGGQPFQYGFNGGQGQGWIVEHQA